MCCTCLAGWREDVSGSGGAGGQDSEDLWELWKLGQHLTALNLLPLQASGTEREGSGPHGRLRLILNSQFKLNTHVLWDGRMSTLVAANH